MSPLSRPLPAWAQTSGLARPSAYSQRVLSTQKTMIIGGRLLKAIRYTCNGSFEYDAKFRTHKSGKVHVEVLGIGAPQGGFGPAVRPVEPPPRNSSPNLEARGCSLACTAGRRLCAWDRPGCSGACLTP